MSGSRCGVCGRWHDHPSRDVAFGLPDAVFELSGEERARRGWISSDICVLDEQTHFVRGVLYVPVSSNGGQIRWGVWAHISGSDFGPHSRIWGTRGVTDIAEFPVHLANEVHPYPGSMGLDLMIRVQGGTRRPTFTVISDTHQLGIDQRLGIGPDVAAEQMAPYQHTHAHRPPTVIDRVRWLARRVWPGGCYCGSQN
jgi:hypothetical protein